VLKSHELRRLVTDLIWCYTIVFGHVDVDIGGNWNFRSHVLSLSRAKVP